MSTPAGGNLIGDASINVNANTDPAARALRDFSRTADGRLRDMRGRFVSESRLIGTAFNRAAGGGNAFNVSLSSLKRTAITLAPALIPIAAQAAPIAAGVGAAAVAIGAFAAAAGGQVAALSQAAEAEKKYKDSVDEHGAASKEAIQAQAAYVRQVQTMPPATRAAAASLSSFKDQYKQWSDSLAGDTMPVVTKGLQTFGAVFPKLTPMVQGAGTQLDRFVTIAAGGVASPGFDRFMTTFGEFSTGALARGNDMLIRFMRTLNTGAVKGGAAEFMDYVRANGPLVRETLANLGQALSNVMQAAANVGPGMLTVVNALAGLVAAVPPGVITTMLQLAIAIKAVRLAAVAMAATSGGMASVAASIGAMRLAAAGATGVLPRLGAAIATLSRTAKVAIAGTGIGLLLIALSELSQIGQSTPPDVDKLTKSLEKLGHTGKATGYAAQEFGANFQKLRSQIDRVVDPSVVESINNWGADITGGFLDAGDDTEKFTQSIDAIDKSLADMVSGGKAAQAAAAIEVMTKGMDAQQLEKFNSGLGDYKASLADVKFEQQLAAQAMGLFGQQAQATSSKLAAQKASADGLRQAIQALNDANRSALGGQIAFDASIDAATKAAQENAGALRMVNGVLDTNSPKAQAAATALNDLGTKTDEAAAAARESGASWQTVNGIYERGRQTFISSAMAMGLNRQEATQLARSIGGIPESKATKYEMRTEDAITGLNSVISAIEKTPGSKSVTVKALTTDAVGMLRDLGFKVTQLPDGRFTVTAATKAAKDNLAAVQRARDGLKDKSITLSARDRASAAVREIQRAIAGLRSKTVTITTVRQVIAKYNTIGRPAQGEGGVSKYAAGGTPSAGEMAMVGERGPELVVFGEAARVFDAQTTRSMLSGTVGAGRAAAQGLAAGLGSTGSVYAAARAMAAAVTSGVREELQIASPSKKLQKIGKDTGAGFIKGLTGTKAQINSTAKSIASAITTAFKGTGSRTDDRLVRMLNTGNARLQKLAGQRDALAKRIADANKFAADTAGRARATGALASIVEDDAYSPKFVKGQMQASLNAIKAFTSNVSKLQKKGVNKDLLRQILEMGPEQGAAFAKSLAGADAATIKQFNSLNSQINSASSKLGKTGADMLFDSGKKASQGFLTGLKAQQKDIEKLMLSIAKSMQKSIKKALGIKSPSRVMDALGRLSILGLQQGIVRSVPAVRTAMTRVAGAVASGVPGVAAPRVATPALAVGAQRTSSGAASAVEVHNHYHLGIENRGVIGSQMQMQDWLVKSLDNLARTGRLPAAVRGAA
jgi:trimeric autotransporter adhesin